jgi:hypothetical protein
MRGGGGVIDALITPAWATMAMVDGSMPVNLLAAADGSSFGTTYLRATFADTGTQVHVSPTGNDGTGDGSSGSPYLTINAAIAAASAGNQIVLAAGRYAPASFNKNLSIICETSDAYVGDLLTEADITWGALGSGRQTATLASGTVSGFADLSGTLRGWPLVAIYENNINTFAARQDAGLPVFTDNTNPPALGAFDSRDMDGEADGNLLVWAVGSAAPLAFSGTPNVFCRGVHFIGGAQILVPAGARLVMEGCGVLGSTGQMLQILGESVLIDGCARGARDDIVDYQDSSLGVEINMVVDFSSRGGADNASTAHSFAKIMRIGGQYWDSPRVIHDINATDVATLGATIGQTYVLGEALLKWGQPTEAGRWPIIAGGITFVRPEGTTYDIMRETGAGVPITYLGSTTGLSKSGTINDTSFTADFSAAIIFKLDPSDLSTLWQNADGTGAVTAAGQTVLRVDDANGGDGVLLHRTGTGTAPIYRTSGGLHWLELAGDAYLDLSGYGARASHGVAMFAIETSSNDYMLFTGDLSNRVAWARENNTGGSTGNFRINGSGAAITMTQGELYTAISTGVPVSITAMDANFSISAYDDANLFSYATGRFMAGKVFGATILDEPRGAQFLAEEAAIRALAGLT